MTVSADPQRFFTERHRSYARFIRLVRYRQGLRSFLLASPLLRPGLRILDAGCGTGALTLAVWEALARRGLSPEALHAFDLTPAMLDRLRETLRGPAADAIELRQADVLDLDDLPASWTSYDLIVSASMLEYVPRDRLVAALAGLRARLAVHGTFLLFTTRRNPLTRLLIGRWWRSNLYAATEIEAAFRAAGFAAVVFRTFPTAARHLALWGHAVEGRTG
jgi:SAM-dependent methyltransferase